MNLTDLATVKRYLSIYTTNSDAKLNGLIPDQSAAFLNETGRTTFDLSSFTEVRDGLGVDTMQLAYFPVVSVESLSISGRVLTASAGWSQRGFLFDALGKITLIGATFSCNPSISFDRKNVVVTYTAGYPNITIANELQTIPAAPTSPQTNWPQALTIYAGQPNWRSNVSVTFFAGGATLTPVVGAPAAGQYFLLGNGAYLFNIADVGKQVFLSYVAAGYPADLVGAVNRMTALRYYQQGHEDLKQNKVAEGTTTYSKEAYPRDVMRVIQNYKKYFFAAGF